MSVKIPELNEICKHGLGGDLCFECFPYGYAAKDKRKDTDVKVAMDPVQLFIFTFGQLMGGVMRDDVQAYLKDHGVPQDKIDEFRVLTMEIAQAFYK
jgi:hypothetical protein